MSEKIIWRVEVCNGDHTQDKYYLVYADSAGEAQGKVGKWMNENNLSGFNITDVFKAAI